MNSKKLYYPPRTLVFKYDSMKMFMYHIAFFALASSAVVRSSFDGWVSIDDPVIRVLGYE